MEDKFDIAAFDLRTTKYKKKYNEIQDLEALKYDFALKDAEKAIARDKFQNPSKLNDLTGLVPPLRVNEPQKKFIEFWFGTKNADTIISNRDKIYYGQLNASCPNFDDPLATQPYVNYATQKLECRRPIPDRRKLLADPAKRLNCIKYAENGPNPFAVESYITEDGKEVCRVPVVRGKFFCNEKADTTAPLDQQGTHMTLPDGTGICIPQSGNFPHAEVKPAPAARTVNLGIYSKLFSDRIVQMQDPSEIASSTYYNLFSNLRLNHYYVDAINTAVRLGRENGKNKIIEYLQGMDDPRGGVFKQVIDSLYSDPLPDALYRYHRDLYFYIKKNYPGYFQKGVIPNEDRMYFLGYEGPWVFNKSVVHV